VITLQQLALFVLAAATVAIAMGVCGPVVVSIRNRRFAIGEAGRQRTDRKVIAAEWGIPETAPANTAIAARLDCLGRPLSVLHEQANQCQNAYHRRVASCVSCLALALGVLGLGLTVLKHHQSFELYSATVEVVALTAAFQQWWAARAANHRWIAIRTKVELLRQWTFLSTLFRPTVGPAIANEMEREFEEKAAEIDARVVKEEPTPGWQWLAAVIRSDQQTKETIEDWLRQYWTEVHAQYLAMLPAAAIMPNDFYLYLRRRPIRQLSWFRLAQIRLQRAAKLREASMALLFTLSIGLALSKAGLIVHHLSASDHSVAAAGPSYIDFAALGLFAAMTVSASVTTLYLSRNDRSLLHRYAAQERSIEDWLRRVLGDPSARFEHPARTPLDASLNKELLDFERLMTDELIDWIHISSHDALELGP
jgi:hypothetical protein